MTIGEIYNVVNNFRDAETGDIPCVEINMMAGDLSKLEIPNAKVRYEYMIQDAECTSVDHIRHWLNGLGDEGWQVVDVRRHRGSLRNSESSKPPTFYLMREKG